MHTQVGLTLEEIKRILINGFKSAFLPFHVKQAWMRRTSRDLMRFKDDGTIAPITDAELGEKGVGGDEARA